MDVPNDIPYNACVLLNNDKLLCLPKYFYDIKTGTVSETGYSENFGTITKIIPLANGQILFSSNYNYIRIYDPIKNKFKTLSRRKYFIDGEDLKDGRALLYGYRELYIYKYDK